MVRKKNSFFNTRIR